MKRAALIVMLAAIAAVAQADPVAPETFDDRVRLAKAAEIDERFTPYPGVMYKRAGRRLARTMRTCIAASPAPQAKSFVLVADIQANGKADAIEVKPNNAVSRCFATGFSAASYARPPQYPGRTGFPVTMKIRAVR